MRHPLDLRAGNNLLVGKSCEGEGEWYFDLRITDAEGQRTAALTYEAHETLAAKLMERVECETRDRWPVHEIMLVHRTGYLGLGEISVVPGRNEMYVWYVFLDAYGDAQDGGIWKTVNSGVNWTAISVTRRASRLPVRSRNGTPAHRQLSISARRATYVSVTESRPTFSP